MTTNNAARYSIPGAGDTLLSYALLTDPDPLQAGASGAILTLVISNSGNAIVTVSSLVVTFLAGSNAKDLVPTPGAGGSIPPQAPTGWGLNNESGSITLTPSGSAGQIGP